MKKHFAAAMALALPAVFVAVAAADDPVLMTVNGKDVHVSEFNYLYNKNNSQQVQPQTIDEYVDMFVDYKLKVADAEAAGIDTTKAFKDEYNQFVRELSAPYMRDQSVEDANLSEAYNHLLRDVRVSHIMMEGNRRSADTEAERARIDSVRNAILNGEITFEEAAALYSIDRASKVRGGYMGYASPGRLPWAFEKVAYETPVGKISEPVNSGYGYHIIRVESNEPTQGEVEVAHILRLTRNKSEAQAAAEKARIDSIYQALLDGADFATLARSLSEDPGSARRGGDIDYFRHGTMVAEFDSVAFALPVGEISKPFATSYGYHVMLKKGQRGVPALDDVREKLLSQINGDERGRQPEQVRMQQFIDRYNSHLIEENLTAVQNRIEANAGGFDSLMRAELAKSDLAIGVVDGVTFPLSEVMAGVSTTASRGSVNARNLIGSAARRLLESKTRERACVDLAIENEDYRNLINEYRDGILLFDISSRNVWDRASEDTKGLEKFFKANRKKYAWDSPRFKGYVVFAPSDSTLEAAMQYADSAALTGDFVKAMRDRFGRDVKIERVIAAKGENAITDYLAFGGEKPTTEKGNAHWASYQAYAGRIIDAPEEAADVRGAVVTDYQQKLEQEWLKKIRKKYRHKVNKDVLNTLR